MIMSIISPNMRLSDKQRRIVEQRLFVILGRISNRIHRVSIALTDENGPKGGVDKHCRARVSVRGFGIVTTEGRHEDLLASVDKAVRRARQVILKRLERRVDRSRKQIVVGAVADVTDDVAVTS